MRSVALVATAMITSVTQPASAQRSSTEWRTKPAESRFRPVAANDASRELHNFARCVANGRYDRARALVLAPYASSEQASVAKKIVVSSDDPCMTASYSEVRMRLNGQLLAGALSQALVLNDYPDLPTVIGSYTPVPPEENTRVAQLNSAEVFGRCVVRRDPAHVLALFSASPGTPAEDEAMRGLGDDLSPCLAVGSTLRVNRLFLRGVTGVAAYRLAQQVQPRERGRVTVAGAR